MPELHNGYMRHLETRRTGKDNINSDDFCGAMAETHITLSDHSCSIWIKKLVTRLYDTKNRDMVID